MESVQVFHNQVMDVDTSVTHLPCINTSIHEYSQTRIIVSMDVFSVSMSSFPSARPDHCETHDFGNKLTVHIYDLPQIHKEDTFFIFYMQDRHSLQIRELFRFVGCEGDRTNVQFRDVYIDFRDAMQVLTNACKIMMVHGSIQSPQHQVHLGTRLAYK